MTKQLWTLDEFCLDLPNWYEVSNHNEYSKGWRKLLACLPAKADELGYFDMRDLCTIAVWGGNLHGVKRRMQANNTPEQVKRATAQAFRQLDEPCGAMWAIAAVNHWGVSYGSKTLTFMRPSDYAILDSWIRRALVHVIPTITDGSPNSVVKGYVSYLDCCRVLQRNVTAPPPVATTNGRWRIADIGQGLFEFARSGGILTPQ